MGMTILAFVVIGFLAWLATDIERTPPSDDDSDY